jgi:hypothetical protein
MNEMDSNRRLSFVPEQRLLRANSGKRPVVLDMI